MTRFRTAENRRPRLARLLTRTRATLLGLACLTMPWIANGAQAQSNAEFAGYLALIYTPVGALAPLAPGQDLASGRDGRRLLFRGRWGRLSPDAGLSNNTIGAGVELPMGRWVIGGTLGYLSVSCTEEWEEFSDCDSDIMIGASARRTVLQRPLRGGSAGTPARRGSRARPNHEETLVLGFEGSTGFSPRQGEQALALSASLPAGIAVRTGTMRILPFLAPGLGYGRLGHTSFSEDEPSTSYASTLLMVGGGVGFDFMGSGFGATFGFQKVLRSGGGGTAIGLTMNWSGSSSSR